LSSFRDRLLPNDVVVFGEVGLACVIRPVPSGQERLNEVFKHCFKKVIYPAANMPKGGIPGMQIHGVKKLSEALEAFDEL
ncbi:DNA repair protein RadA, partial [Vibrio parahaemolyticus]